jgi:hypothetical protein
VTGCLHPHVALIGDAPAQLQRKCRSCGQAFGLCQRHGIYPQLDAAGCPKCLPLTTSTRYAAAVGPCEENSSVHRPVASCGRGVPK